MNCVPLKYKQDYVPGYSMDMDGNVYIDKNGYKLKRVRNKMNRPIYEVWFNGYKQTLRVDYLVMSTLKTFPKNVMRIIHVDEDPWNCDPNNLIALTTDDVIEKYKEMYNVDSLDEIKEEWKVSTIDTTVEVSNFGSVRDLETKEPVKTSDNHGYRWYHRNGTYYHVHRLVATEFVENPKPHQYTIINHIDGVKHNNAAWNLEWCDLVMNGEHAMNTGLMNKYPAETIHHVCQLLQEGVPQINISTITGVNRKYISDIYRGRRNSKISSQYDFPKKCDLDKLYKKDELSYIIKGGAPPSEAAQLIGVDPSNSFKSYYNRLKKKIEEKRSR